MEGGGCALPRHDLSVRGGGQGGEGGGRGTFLLTPSLILASQVVNETLTASFVGIVYGQ